MTDQPKIVSAPQEGLTTADLLQQLGLKEAQRAKLTEFAAGQAGQIRELQIEVSTLKAQLKEHGKKPKNSKPRKRGQAKQEVNNG